MIGIICLCVLIVGITVYNCIKNRHVETLEQKDAPGFD